MDTPRLRHMLQDAQDELASAVGQRDRINEQIGAIEALAKDIERILGLQPNRTEDPAQPEGVRADAPKGREAIMLILKDREGQQVSIDDLAREMVSRGWKAADSDQERQKNAARTAAARAVAHYSAIERVENGLYLYNAEDPAVAGSSDVSRAAEGGGSDERSSVAD